MLVILAVYEALNKICIVLEEAVLDEVMRQPGDPAGRAAAAVRPRMES